MQANDNYLDELFARKLRNMEATPPEDGWTLIENELNRRIRTTRRYWMVAASLALVLSVTATVVYMQTSVNDDANQTVAIVVPENTSQDIEKNISQGDEISATVLSPPAKKQITSENNSVVFEADDEQTPIRSNIPAYIDSYDEIIKKQPIKENWRQIRSEQIIQLKKETFERKADETLAAALPTAFGYDEMRYLAINDVPTRSKTRNHWNITGQFAPMYAYRAISSVPGGMRKSDFDAAESPLLAYSGGINLSRKILNRLDVQIGIFYSQMGQTINNVIPVNNMYSSVSSNNSYNKNFVSKSFVRTSSGSVTVASILKSDINTTYDNYFNPETQVMNNSANIVSPTKCRLIEQLDYLEIPIVLRYRIIDRKLNVYVLGGMSANVLIDNNVFVDNGGDLVKGGTILMARPVNYSSTLGLGIGYQITQSLSIGLEPLFKYYLQPYTTNSQIGSNPYAFGVFTGVIYRF
jgi:hypothetical protein